MYLSDQTEENRKCIYLPARKHHSCKIRMFYFIPSFPPPPQIYLSLVEELLLLAGGVCSDSTKIQSALRGLQSDIVLWKAFPEKLLLLQREEEKKCLYF